MLDDIGELLDESEQRIVKIQVDGHVDGDSETTTGTIKNTNEFQVNKVKGESKKLPTIIDFSETPINWAIRRRPSRLGYESLANSASSSCS